MVLFLSVGKLCSSCVPIVLPSLLSAAYLLCISLICPVLLPGSSPTHQLLYCSPVPPAGHPLLVCIEALVFSLVLLDLLFSVVLFCSDLSALFWLHEPEIQKVVFILSLPVHLFCSTLYSHFYKSAVLATRRDQDKSKTSLEWLLSCHDFHFLHFVRDSKIL